MTAKISNVLETLFKAVRHGTKFATEVPGRLSASWLFAHDPLPMPATGSALRRRKAAWNQGWELGRHVVFGFFAQAPKENPDLRR